LAAAPPEHVIAYGLPATALPAVAVVEQVGCVDRAEEFSPF
jgi:hypothetical protein